MPAARLRPVALAAASALGLLGAPLQAAGPAPATLPTGLNVVHGQAQVATVLKGAAGQTTAQMTVRNSAGAILNWNSFSIGAQAGVHFQQADATSKVLNRVTGSDPSAIFGSLTSNGQVWLLNPNGVLFGAGARVDVAGLVASTLRLDDNSFLDGLRSGRFSFGEGAAGIDGASVRNEGAIRTAHGGHLVMLSERVENAGTLDAPGGALLLAGAKAATLVDSALPYLAAVVPAGEVLNLGRAAADGGVVDVYAAVVNQQGLVRADTVAVDAQGRVVLKAADTLMLGAASRTSAAGTAEGSTGGRIDLLGTQVGLVGAATVDVSGTAGGGAIRLGGGLMGRDAGVANSRAVFVGPEALLLADATGAAGMGGSIILWSDEATRAYGRFSARGGSARGDGGFIETSGGWIDARPSGIDVTTRGGVAGTWLIDPNNLTISDTGPDTAITGGPSFSTTGDGARITTATIATALNGGNSVTLTTATGGTEAGDILMLGANLSVAPSSAVTLTLRASRDIVVQDSTLSSSAAPLNLDFQSAGLGTGVIDIYNSTIATAGGNVRLGGQNVLALPLPGGDTLPGTWRPAVSYLVGSGPASLSRTGGRTAINIEASTLEMGSGSLLAVGLNTVDNQDGVSVSSDTGATTLVRGAVLELVGVSVVPTPVDTDVGVFINGNGTDLVATERITIDGAGRNGVGLTTGARITLNGGVGAGASLAIRGWSSDDIGVALLAGNFDPGPATRGSRLTVNNGSLLVQGRTVATATPGVEIFNVDGAPGPILDLDTATGATLETVTGGSYASGVVRIDSVGVAPPAAGTLTLRAPGVLNVNALSVTGAAGPLVLEGSDILLVGSNLLVAPPAATSLTMNATRDILVRDSAITSTGSPLSLNLVSAGGGVGAIEIQRSSITTAGGNVTLGGATAAAMPLPDGTFTSVLFSPAIGYDTATAPFPTALTRPRDAIYLDSSTVNAGSGNFSAVGLAAGSLSISNIAYGVRFAGTTAPTRVSAANIDVSGFGRTDRGRGVVLIGVDLAATAGMQLFGAGLSLGVNVSDARIGLDAAAGSGAVLSIEGFSGLATSPTEPQIGVLIQNGTSGGVVDDAFTVVNGRFEVTGRSLGAPASTPTPASGRGVQWLVDAGAGGTAVINDFRAATGVRIEGDSLNALGVYVRLGDLQLPTAVGATSELVSIAGGVQLETLTLSGSGSVLVRASDGSSDPGDIVITGSSFTFAPGTATTLLAQAARDIVVQNSSITSTGAPLNIEVQAAGNEAFGVVSLSGSTITTAGGNLTLGGTLDRQLPLPGGGLTTATFRPARAYSTATGGASSALDGGQDAVRIDSSVITLGAGTFRAVGEGALDARDGFSLSSDAGPMRLTAAQVQVIGHAPAPTAVDGDRIGVIVGGQDTEITATQSILIQAAGDAGGEVGSGARLTLAGSGSGSIVIDGSGGAREGSFLASFDVETGAPGRGTRITVSGGTLSVTGRSAFGSIGLALDNSVGAPGPLLDLSAATGASVISGAGSGANVFAVGVDIVTPAAGSLGLASLGQLRLSEVFVSGAGSLSLSGATVEVDSSTILSTGSPLALSFATTGALPRGVALENTIVETRGGDVTFGAPGTVSSTLLGTSAPGFWLEKADSGAFSGLQLIDSVVDAGTGRIRGGGAARSSATDSSGLEIFRSVLTGSTIDLAGRSDTLEGLRINESTLNATSVLRLAGDSASNSPPSARGVQIGLRSTLQLVDPAAAAGSSFSIRGNQLTNGIGLLIEGGAVGSGNETRLTIEGAAATLSGTSGSGSGLVLLGSGAGPGGAFINAAAAPSLRLEGLVTLDAATGGTGTGLELSFANIIGPQLSAASPLDIVANGGGAVGAGLRIGSSSVSSGGVTTVAGNSIAIADSLLSGDGSINLYAVDQGASAGSVVIDRAALQVGATAGSRVYAGTRTGGPAIGVAGIASGNGIQINDVALSASVSSGSIELRGTGAASGGSGVVFARSPMTAPTITMVGRGGFDGDGVFSDDLSAAPSTLRTANLAINGLAAHDPAATSLTRAGVVLGRGVVLDLDSGATALIEGDLIALGRSGVSTGTGLVRFQAQGAATSFTVNATRSMLLSEATLDFSTGSGTAITLRGDTDDTDGGRVRITAGSVVRSGNGDITLEGHGSATASATGGLPAATVVLEGGTGVFLSGGTLDAGSGVITLTGRTWDFGTGASTEPSVGGVLLQGGVNSLTARRVQMDGSTVSSGFGVTIGLEGATTPQTVNADEIVITGNGVGTVSSVGLAAPGVLLFGGASLQAGTSLQLVGNSGSGVLLDTAQAVSLGSLTIDGAGPVRSIGSVVSAEGALSIVGIGSSTENGVTIATGALIGAGPLNSLTRGDSVLIRGLNSAGARGVLLQGDDGIGNITTYTGAATITAGSDPLGGAVAMVGRWILNPAGALNIESPGGLALAVGATSGLAPLFGGDAINLSIADGGTVTYGPGGSIDAALFQAALPTAAVPLSLRVVGGGALEMAGSLSVAGRLRLDAEGGVGLVGSAAVVSTAPGDAIVIGGNSGASPSFVNLAGASALSTPGGRWVIFTTGPAATTLGGLDPAFSAYGLGAAPWGVTATGDLITPIGGNALGYRLGAAAVSGAALSVLQTRAYDTTAAITLDPGSWAVSGLVTGDMLALAGSTAATMADKNVGVAKPVTPDAAAVFSVVDASGRPVFGYDAPALAATITPVALTVSGTAVANKVYDGGVGLTIASLGSVTPLAGDEVSIDVASVTAAFVDRNVGTAKPVLFSGLALTGADAGNYTVALPTGLTADITPLGLAVTGLAAASRVYDSTTLATLTGSATIAPLGSDAVTLAGTALASFADKNVANAKPVSVSGYTLAGADAGNYTLLAPAGLAADITPAALALSGLTAVSRVYDATTVATVSGTATLAPALGSDVVTLSGAASGTFADRGVGTAKPVALGGLTLAGADAGNYVITAPGLVADITPANLAVTGLAAASRVYDASTTALLTGSATVAPLGADGVTLAGTATGAFADKNVGTAKPVAVSGLTLAGADAGNYTLVAPAGLSADITARALAVTGVAAADKVYDTTTAATLSGVATISPLGADVLTLGGTAVASFADKNAGPAKPVSVSGYTLAGADAANYALVQPVGLSATISAAPLAVTGLSAVSREYDRSTAAPLAGTAAVVPLSGDVVTLAGTAAGAFATAAVDTGKPVTVSGLALAGADAANYTLLLPTGLSADVTPRTLTLAGLVADGRVYDAGTAVAVSGTLVGVLTGDAVGLALSGRLADANVGTAKPVTLSAALSGADAGNYTLAAPGGLSASITPATLRYVALPAFGTSGQALPVLTGDVSGFLGADTRVSATTGALAWTSLATAASPAGLYAINGGGLAALNYLFVQDAANASALTLRAAAVSDPVTTTTTVVTTSALFSVSVPLLMSSPTEGRTLDVTPAFAGSVGAEAERRARIAAAPGREGAAGAAALQVVPGTPAAAVAAGAAAAASPAGPAGALGAPAATPSTAATGAAAAPGGAAAAAVLPSVAAVLSAASSEAAGGLSFGALDFSRLPRDEIQTLLAARARYKKQIFADGIYRLQQDPTLADVRPCRNEAETDTGQCLITEDLKRQIQAAREEARLRAEAAAAAAAAATVAPGTAAPPRPARVQRRVVQAALPVIERKLALLIGVNDYADKAVPQLEGAVRDARAVRERLEQRMGYETTVLESPSRSEIVRAFNRLALEAQPGDSVIVYYAGHGVVVPVNGVDTGFWLPADTDSRKESTWLSNADIGRLVAAIGSRQLMLVSDSCYSGTLVGKERGTVSGNNPDEMLKRRAAVVMSSGGDEPVADEGKDGHSFFAWHFMRALEGLDRWQVGNSLHERLRTAVSREFPQTPQYGGSRGLGHESDTDFLFERREIEKATQAP